MNGWYGLGWHLTAWRARAVLAALLLLFGASAVTSIPNPAPPGIPVPTVADGEMFDTVITRLRSGEPYYTAMGNELRRRYYPASSIFNWRTPLLYKLTAAAPDWVRPLSFASLGVLVLVLTTLHLRRMPMTAILVGLLAQAGALAAMWSALPETEPWCGVLLVISVLAYSRASSTAGALVGLAALFVRELAAPFCVACILLALAGRRRRELTIWFCGIVIYALFYYWHVTRVWAHQLPGDFDPASWVRFGGLPFLLETIQKTNALLVAMPPFITAGVVLLLASAVWAPAIPQHVGAVVIVYGLFFFVIGQIFNDYWGFVTAPTWAVALAYGVGGFRGLTNRAWFEAPVIETSHVENVP